MAAIIGAMGTVGVWFLSARHLRKRDHDSKKREIRVQYLIEAYRGIEQISNRDFSPSHQYARDFEAAIGDIQLFGNIRQIELAQEVAKDFAVQGSASSEDLLDELRKDLRRELDLEPALNRRVILRIKQKPSPNQPCGATRQTTPASGMVGPDDEEAGQGD